MPELDNLLTKAREISWANLGKRIIFYLPGMFRYNNRSGKYPAISITGSDCELDCDHCQTKILMPMVSAKTPDLLVKKCLQLEKKGNVGILISGGCDKQGCLPWHPFIAAIERIKKHTNLYVSIHSGLVDLTTALALKNAGVDQALIDVIGDDQTFQDIYHVDFGVSRIHAALDALQKAEIPMVPHIVCGLHYGRINGEEKAIEMISNFDVEQLVIVSLMRLRGTPLWETNPLKAEAVAEIIAAARLKMPRVKISMGCARQRGNTDLEILAIDAGVNRLALPSEEAIQRAEYYGLEIRYQRTCCSVTREFFEPDDKRFTGR